MPPNEKFRRADLRAILRHLFQQQPLEIANQLCFRIALILVLIRVPPFGKKLCIFLTERRVKHVIQVAMINYLFQELIIRRYAEDASRNAGVHLVLKTAEAQRQVRGSQSTIAHLGFHNWRTQIVSLSEPLIVFDEFVLGIPRRI